MADIRQKILIVDDERFNINVLNDLLKNEYKTMVAISGKQALKAAESPKPPDLILLDINMMEVDGTILFEVIHLFCKKAKVIVTSVYPLDEQKKRIKGADEYYDKSDSLQILIRKVRQVMKSNLNSIHPASV